MSLHHAGILLCTLKALEASLRQDVETSEELNRRDTTGT